MSNPNVSEIRASAIPLKEEGFEVGWGLRADSALRFISAMEDAFKPISGIDVWNLSSDGSTTYEHVVKRWHRRFFESEKMWIKRSLRNSRRFVRDLKWEGEPLFDFLDYAETLASGE